MLLTNHNPSSHQSITHTSPLQPPTSSWSSSSHPLPTPITFCYVSRGFRVQAMRIFSVMLAVGCSEPRLWGMGSEPNGKGKAQFHCRDLVISLNHKSSYEPSGKKIIGHPIMFVGRWEAMGISTSSDFGRVETNNEQHLSIIIIISTSTTENLTIIHHHLISYLNHHHHNLISTITIIILSTHQQESESTSTLRHSSSSSSFVIIIVRLSSFIIVRHHHSTSQSSTTGRLHL